MPQSCLQWVDSKDKISNAILKKSTQETNTTSYLSNINHWFPLFTTRANYAMPRALNIAWLNCLLYSLSTRLSWKRLRLQREGYEKCLGKAIATNFYYCCLITLLHCLPLRSFKGFISCDLTPNWGRKQLCSPPHLKCRLSTQEHYLTNAILTSETFLLSIKGEKVSL